MDTVWGWGLPSSFLVDVWKLRSAGRRTLTLSTRTSVPASSRLDCKQQLLWGLATAPTVPSPGPLRGSGQPPRAPVSWQLTARFCWLELAPVILLPAVGRWLRKGPNSPWGPTHWFSGPAGGKSCAPSPWAGQLWRQQAPLAGLTVVLTSGLQRPGDSCPFPLLA